MKQNRELLAISALLLTSALLVPVVAEATGYYYEMVGTTESPQSRKGETQKFEGWVDDDSTKVIFHTGQKEGFFADGSYVVTNDGGENVYLINPKEKTYSRFDMAEMMGTMGAAFNMMEQMGGMVQMEFTDVSHEKISEGPGESMLGCATTHLQTKTAYTMRMAIMGMKRENRNETIQDMWMTDDYDAAGFGVWLRPDRNMRTGNEGLDQLMDASWRTLTGFPLKTVAVTTMTNKKGKTSTSTHTNEVVVLREESVSADSFVVPDGYTETELMPQMPEGYQQQQQEAGKKDKKKKKKGLSSVFGGDDDGR